MQYYRHRIAQYLVRKNCKEIDLYNSLSTLRHPNTLRYELSQADTVEKAEHFLDMSVKEFIEYCLGKDCFTETRWRVTAEKATRANSVAGRLSEIVYYLFCSLCEYIQLPYDYPECILDISIASRKEAEKYDADRLGTVVIHAKKDVVIKAETEPCEVPKKIATSPTVGTMIRKIEYINDCMLRELIGNEEADRMVFYILETNYVGYLHTKITAFRDLDASISSAIILQKMAAQFEKELLKLEERCAEK